MYFLALSQAPPPDVMEMATNRPVTMVPSSIAPNAETGICLNNNFMAMDHSFTNTLLDKGHITAKTLMQSFDIEGAKFIDFYLTEDATYRVREHGELCGVDPDLSIREIIEECIGKQVLVSVVQVPSQREGSDDMYNEVRGYAAVE